MVFFPRPNQEEGDPEHPMTLQAFKLRLPDVFSTGNIELELDVPEKWRIDFPELLSMYDVNRAKFAHEKAPVLTTKP